MNGEGGLLQIVATGTVAGLCNLDCPSIALEL